MPLPTPVRLRAAAIGVTALLAAAACGREPTGAAVHANPGVTRSNAIGFLAEFPKGIAAFQAAGGSGVAFTKVRVVLNNPDGSVALDTVIVFPPGSDELQVTLSVPLPQSAPASGVPLALNLDYQNASGQTVFHGGPVTVNAVPAVPGAGPPAPTPVTIPIKYTGPGAQAASVRINPRSLTLGTGTPYTFSAQALDASGNVLPNTPIIFSSSDATIGTINAATGVGAAGSVRGTATITAALLTGPSDGATLSVVPPPTRIELVSGGGQSANVNATLPQPVVVRVSASDGVGSPGATVTFSAAGGGTVGSASVSTDASGLASTTWKLGGTPGTQTLTATGGAASVAVTATARPLDPVRLAIATQPPTTVTSGATFGFVVNVLDAAGGAVPTFTGPVTIAIAAGGPAGGVLAGTATVNAVAGVATFAGLSLNRTGSYTLDARAASLTAASTNAIAVTAGPASRLVFQAYPILGGTAGSAFDVVTVEARDANGNVATSFTGAVELSVDAATAASAQRSSVIYPGTTSPPVSFASAEPTILGRSAAVAGVASFDGLRAPTLAGRYALRAAAGGLASASGPAFGVTAGPASGISLVSGGGQVAAAGAALARPIVVQIVDTYGNLVAGGVRSVSFTAGSGGSASPSSTSINSSGQASTTWTLGASAGSQVLTVSSAGLVSLTVTATASGAAAGATVYGYPTDLGSSSTHAPDYLLGSQITVTAPTTLTHFGVLGKSSGALVKLALYTDVGGNPGTLVASVGPFTLANGVNEIPATATLPAGSYWIMGIYNIVASIGIDLANSDVVKYISLPFASALPGTFPAPIVYSGQRFNYYIRVR